MTEEKLGELIKRCKNCSDKCNQSPYQVAKCEIKALEAELKEWDEERVPRLSLVGQLIRGDWSGNEFDGRDVRDWIDLIIDGQYGEFEDDVKSIAEDSILYNEIIKRKGEKK